MSDEPFDARQFVEQLLAAPAADGSGDRAAIDARKAALRIDATAREELATENASGIPVAYPGNEFLLQPDEAPQWRIHGLWPAGGNVVLAAQFKAGKTTLRDNLIKSWCDGEPFLGAFAVVPPGAPIYVIDAEMPSNTARRWLKAHSIQNPGRFIYVNVRGSASSLNLLVPSVRTLWAKSMAGAGAVLLDCLGPVMGALGLDENKSADIGRLLSGFEMTLAEAGVPESLVIHHMGHAAERSRGASRLRDWPDAEWRLVRQDDNPASARYLSAFGRDVDLSESRLSYDSATRRLALSGGSRKDAKVTAARAAVTDLIAAEPGLSAHAIEERLSDPHGRNAVRSALAEAVKEGEVITMPGARGAKLHSLSSPLRHSSPPD